MDKQHSFPTIWEWAQQTKGSTAQTKLMGAFLRVFMNNAMLSSAYDAVKLMGTILKTFSCDARLLHAIMVDP
jgi:hypothetical protein